MTQTATVLNTVPESADRWRVSVGTVWRLIRCGEVEIVRIADRTFIEESEIVRLIDAGRVRRGGEAP